MDLQKAVALYLETLENETTRTNYAIVLRDFCQNFERLIDIDTRAVMAYKQTLEGKSPQTVASRTSAIKSFLMFCWEQNWIPSDPTIPIKTDSVQRYQHSKNVSLEEFKTLLAQTNVKTLAGLRDYLLLRLLFILGDLDKVLELKIKTALPEMLEADRKTYITMLSQHIPIEELKNGYLFFGLEKMDCTQKLSLSSVRKVLQKYCAMAGFPEKYFDTTAIRRLRARQIYEQTNSVPAVQKFLGHNSPVQTKTFLKTLFPNQKHF